MADLVSGCLDKRQEPGVPVDFAVDDDASVVQSHGGHRVAPFEGDLRNKELLRVAKALVAAISYRDKEIPTIHRNAVPAGEAFAPLCRNRAKNTVKTYYRERIVGVPILHRPTRTSSRESKTLPVPLLQKRFQGRPQNSESC